MQYATIVKDYPQAQALQEKLKALGVDSDDISIVLRTQSNEYPADLSAEKLSDTKSLEEAPTGTVSIFGASFSVLTAMASGALLLGFGPIAALAGGAAVAGSGIGMLLNGIGVPEEKHDYFIDRLQGGEVLVAVRTEQEDTKIAQLMHSTGNADEA